MAKERVQVQGLGDVAPGIQPTIQRAGQYAVAQVRAAPVPVPRSKLLDLADTLKVGQDLLQQYGLAAEQEAQMFEEELSRKSPEEVQAMLKKTEGELDKQVRRGAMGWLTSPLNQKRKLQAVGRVANRMFMERLQSVDGRLNNPKEGDEELGIAGILQQEQEAFFQENPALASSFAAEGFQESLNAQRLGLIRQYDQNLNNKAKSEFLVNSVDAAYDMAVTGKFSEDFTPEQEKNLLDIFDGLGSFDAAQQEKFMQGVIGQVALRSQDHAIRLLDWAARKGIKIGQAEVSVGSRIYDELEDLIIENGARARSRADDQRAFQIKEQTLAAVSKLNVLREGGTFELNGKTYEGKADVERFLDDVILAAREDPEKDDAYVGGLIKSLEQIQTLAPDLREQQAAKLAKNTVDRRNTSYSALIASMRDSDKDELLVNEDGELLPEYENLKLELKQEFQQEMDNYMLEVSGMDISLHEQKKLVGDRSLELVSQLQSRLDKGIVTIKSNEAKRSDAKKELQALEVKTDEAPAPSGLFSYQPDSLNERVAKTAQAKRVIFNVEAKPEERDKSIKYLSEQGEDVLNELSNKAQSNSYIRKVVPVGIARNRGYTVVSEQFGYPPMVEVIDRYLTPEELEENYKQYMITAGFGNAFTDLKTLETGVTKHGLRFDVSELKERTMTVRMIPAFLLENLKDLEEEDLKKKVEQVQPLEETPEMGKEFLGRRERGTEESALRFVKGVSQYIGQPDIVKIVKDQLALNKRLKLIK